MKNKIFLTSDLKIIEYPEMNNQGIRQNENFDRNNDYSNGKILSDRTKIKIKRLMAAYAISKVKTEDLRWVTLTLPDLWQDERGFKMNYEPSLHDGKVLTQFIKWLENLRKNYGLVNYIWVAERQDGKRKIKESMTDDEKNKILISATNRIHFHVLMEFSERVEYSFLNRYWCYLISEIGYQVYTDKIFLHDEFYQKMKSLNNVKNIDALKRCINNQIVPDYVLKYDYKHPINKVLLQPVQVDAIKNISTLSGYMSKYVSKNENKIFCRNWSCTHEISRLKTKVEITETDFNYLMQNAEYSETHEVKLFETSTTNLQIEVKAMVHCFDYKSYDLLADYFTQKLISEKWKVKLFRLKKRKLNLKNKLYEKIKTDKPGFFNFGYGSVNSITVKTDEILQKKGADLQLKARLFSKGLRT